MQRTTSAFAGASSSSSESSENEEEFADFNPRKRRRTGRDPKEAAALGVFGSESEDDGPRWKRKERKLRNGGVGFVSAGAKKVEDGDEEEDDGDEDDGNMEEEEERPMFKGFAQKDDAKKYEDVDDDEERPMSKEFAQKDNAGEDDEDDDEGDGLSLGMGFKSGMKFKGFSQARQDDTAAQDEQKPTPRRQAYGLGSGFVPSSEAVPVLSEEAVQREAEKEASTPKISRPSAFGTPTSGKGAKNKTGAPMSFAERMMAKMGYKQGEGLGKDGKGRAGIIETKLRPQGVGLGAVKEKTKQEREEEKRQAALRGEVIEDSEEEEKKRRKKARAEKRLGGGDSGTSTPKRASKPKYLSLQNMQSAAPGLAIPQTFKPILDMTGPQQKLLTSSSGLMTPTGAAPAFETAEQAESKKLVRRAHHDLSAFVDEWKNLEERKALAELQITQQQQIIDEQKKDLEQTQAVASLMQELSGAIIDGQWDPVFAILQQAAKIETPIEDLSALAVAAVHPFLRQATEGWQPLEDPKLMGVAPEGFASALRALSSILGVNGKPSKGTTSFGDPLETNGHIRSRTKATTTYESMIYTLWLPKVRSATTSIWDVYNPTPLLNLLETWSPLLPAFIRTQLISHLILNKLREAVSTWNPKRSSSKKSSTPLPHIWLFPWLQYLPDQVDPKATVGLVSDVKRKFRELIDAWDFSRGVIPGLSQWKTVLRPSSRVDTWTPLILNHLLPNLASYLSRDFDIAPQNQEPYLKVLRNVVAWTDVISSRYVAQILVQAMFPKWHDVLHQWLTSPDVNHEEVADWFDWWKTSPELPNAVKKEPAVEAEWQKGTELINAALDLGDDVSKLPPPISSSQQQRREPQAVAVPEPEKPKPRKRGEVKVSFKDTVEAWCADNSLVMELQPRILRPDGPVYRITGLGDGKGGVRVVLEGHVVFVLDRKCESKSMVKLGDELLEMAQKRV